MKKLLSVVCFSVVILALCPTAQAINILYNGDFDIAFTDTRDSFSWNDSDDSGHWITHNTLGWSVSDGVAQTSCLGLNVPLIQVIENSASGDFSLSFDFDNSSTGSLAPVRIFTASHIDNWDNVPLVFSEIGRWEDAYRYPTEGGLIEIYNQTITAWTSGSFSDKLTVPTGVTHLIIAFENYSTGWDSIDNVSFGPTDGDTSVPEPTTMLLLGTGMIGLAGARRKMRK